MTVQVALRAVGLLAGVLRTLTAPVVSGKLLALLQVVLPLVMVHEIELVDAFDLTANA